MLTLLLDVRDCAVHRAVPALADALGNAGAQGCAVACCLATVRLASAGAQQDATTAARDVEQQDSTALALLQRRCEMLASCMAFTPVTAQQQRSRRRVTKRWRGAGTVGCKVVLEQRAFEQTQNEKMPTLGPHQMATRSALHLRLQHAMPACTGA